MPNKKDISVFGTSGSGDDLRLENQPFKDVTIAKRKKVPSKNAVNAVDDIYSNSFVLENGERLSTVVPDFLIKENENGKFGSTSKTEDKKKLSRCHNNPNNRQSNQSSSSRSKIENSDDERAEQNGGYLLRSTRSIEEDVSYSDEEIQEEVRKPTLGRSNQFAKNVSNKFQNAENSQNKYSNKSTHISSQNTAHRYHSQRTHENDPPREIHPSSLPERQNSNHRHVPSTTNPNFGGGFKPPYNAPLHVEKSLPSAPTNIAPIPLRLVQTSPPNFVPTSNQASSPENRDTQKQVTAKPVYGGFKPPYNAPIAPEKAVSPIHSDNLPIPSRSIQTSPPSCPPISYQNSSPEYFVNPQHSSTTTKSVPRGFKPPYNAPIIPSPVQTASSNRANVSPHIYDIPYDNQQQTLSRQSSQSSANRDASYNSQQESLLRHFHTEQPRCHDYIASSPEVYDIPRQSSLSQHEIVSRESCNNIDNRIPAHQNVPYYNNSRREHVSHADEPLRHDYRAKSQQQPHQFQNHHFHPQVEQPHRNDRISHSSNTYQHRRSDSDYSEHYATPHQHSHLVEPLRHDYGSGCSSLAASNNNYYFEESDHSDALVDDRHSYRRQQQQYAQNEKYYDVHDRDFQNNEKFGYANEHEYAQTRQNIDRRLPQAQHYLPQRSLNNNDIDEYAQPRQNNNYRSMDRPLPQAQHYLSHRSLNASSGSAFSKPGSTAPRNQQQRSLTAIPPGLRAIELSRDQNQQINSMIRGIRMMINTADGDLDLRRVGRILGVENICSHPSYLDGFDSNYSWELFISDYMPEIAYDKDLDGEFIFHNHSV